MDRAVPAAPGAAVDAAQGRGLGQSAAAIIEQTPRQLFGGGTSISGAVDHAMSLFPQSPFKSERRVIDVSGDGANNAGRSMTRRARRGGQRRRHHQRPADPRL